MIRPAAQRLANAGVLLLVLGPLACDVRRELPQLQEHTPRPPAPILPDALLVRFKQFEGVGFSREGWEMEILQMGPEVRVRGSVRTAGTAVPVFRNMGPSEYASFWTWLEGFPVDRFRVKEDESAPEPGWTKSLEIDIVLDEERRLVSRNEWTRPAVGASWLAELEDRLHTMVLDYADEEVDRVKQPGDTTSEEVQTGIRRALEALGDAEPSNLPGGSPDVEE